MAGRMRAVIVDDERLARSELRRLLDVHAEVEIVGEAANVEQALRVIGETSPDLLFLDVQMPGRSGFDLLAELEPVPAVVFATAFDEFAFRAFEVSALDYLVKPIEPVRLARALEKVTRQVRPARRAEFAGGAADRSEPMLNEDDRVFVRDGERCWFIRIGEVRLFEAADNYARVHFGAETRLIARALGQLEKRLDPTLFFRANRNQLVNLRAVRTIAPTFDGRLTLRLEDGTEVVVSRRRASDFRKQMTL
jgi:two-component system, LytTR family, response regulator